ncbi:glycosyltransferase [Clostridium perfringens]|uniref:glycosyltransferase n=1 Tax=Clostridium perfringens TaxID=1502 RepID=UPI0010D9DC53|nr:glycosyltransferase [Clostridium perfringens]MDU2661246.1 glycosyltransferase [Clostridioides difficile]MDB2046938.1 glycosyltransferase [Clostridium perfringens]MDB2057985.1 glycosyltransferase [Clostridium perfringens]MDK0612328.1 glycosyltransferase [Clostridium perfringens]MDK0644889.1 glycosyltransferase [Clostridium perfringens]
MKLLIIGMSLNVGGAEKSLVNFLNMIDYNKYEIDLLLFQKKGVFLKQIPNEVNLVDVPEIEVLFQSIIKTIKEYKFDLLKVFLGIKRYFITFFEKKKWKQFDQIRIHRWIDFYSKWVPINEKKYDVGIAYAGGETAYYLVDKVKCNKRVYFFHSDYSEINIDAEVEKKYVEKVDKIITISDACKNSLVKLFPKQKNKMYVLQNLSSPDLINKLSDEYFPDDYKNYKGTKIVSIGRLNKIKGYDMAIEAAKILKDNKIDFKWFIVGEGLERDNLTSLIKKYKLEKSFFLVGLKENPYPYIKFADILVQPSRFEGKSVVLDEAKILAKPIIVTNYNSVDDQIIDGFNGIIVSMNSIGIFEGLNKLIIDNNKQRNLSINCKKSIDLSISNIDSYMSIICK